MTAWFVILAVGVGSYFLRASLLVAITKPLPRAVENALALAGPAAVAAVLATMAFTASGRVHPLAGVELVAIAAGFIAVRRTGNVLHAFTAGLPVLWLGTALGV
jgi:branched-subunit amino acid transport protein